MNTKSTFKFSTQESVKESVASTRELHSYKLFHSLYLAKHYIVDRKDNAHAFIPAELSRAFRNDDSVIGISAVVVDVDNAGRDTSTIFGSFFKHDTPDDAVGLLGLAGVEGSVYSSHSNSAEKPRFRVVIPTDRLMTASEFRKVRSYVHKKLLEIKADECTRKLSQPYFVPTCTPENQNIAFSVYVPGKPLSVNWVLDNYEVPAEEQVQAQTAVQQLSGSTRVVRSDSNKLINRQCHRRERLLALICAMYNAGKPESQAAQELASWDITNHVPENGVTCPYFYDYGKRPKFRPNQGQAQYDRAVQLAAMFIRREYRTLRSKFPQPQQSAQSIGFRPIFAKTFCQQ